METAEDFVKELNHHPMSDKALVRVLELYAKPHAIEFEMQQHGVVDTAVNRAITEGRYEKWINEQN